MAEWVAAESNRSVLGILEELFLLRASLNGPGKSRFQVVNMEVQMDRRPVPLVMPGFLCTTRRFCARGLFEEADFILASA
jgi:hypothetical protein